MKKYVFLLLLLIGYTQMSTAQSKNWGIGVKLGEPSGISIKKYLGKNALELNIGRAYWGRWGNKYYNYDNYTGNAFALQLHYLFQRSVKSIKGLDWYLGVGGQYVNHSYKYRYNKNMWAEYNDTDLGGDLVLGLEYTLAEIPLSFALETGAFVELLDDPFYIRGIGGLAVRFNF